MIFQMIVKYLCYSLPRFKFDKMHFQCFMEYGPSFELKVTPGNQRDTNSDEYLDNVICTVLENLSHIQC